MQWNPYLSFDGKCEAAFQFYEKCLGGKILMMMRWGDMPSEEPTPPEMASKVAHVRLEAGGNLLMGSDSHPAQPYEGIKGSSIALQTETAEEADQIFAALSENATVTMPLTETFWALRFGMLTDQFGIPWMINCEKPRD